MASVSSAAPLEGVGGDGGDGDGEPALLSSETDFPRPHMDDVRAKSLRRQISHIDRIYQTVPLRKYLRHLVESSPIGYAIDIASVVLSLVAIIMYIVSTYMSQGEAMITAELAVSCIFLVEYCFRWYIAKNRLGFVFSISSLIDVVTILPPFLQLIISLGETSWAGEIQTNLGFLRIIRTMKIFRVMQLLRLVRHSGNEVARAIAMMVFSMLALVFCSAGFFLEIESESTEYGSDERYTFHESLYWATVTVSTLGYGDIYPVTSLGQWLVIFMMLIMFTLIPYQTNQVLELMAQGNSYLTRSYRRKHGHEHVVVMGTVTKAGMEDLVSVLFHEDHGFGENDIVFLSDHVPDRATRLLLLSHSKKEQLHYLEGSLHETASLERAKVHKAQMVFILADRNAVDPAEEDTTNIMNTLGVDMFVQEKGGRSAKSGKRSKKDPRTPNRCLVQLLLPQSRKQLVSCIEALNKQADHRVPHTISMVCLTAMKATLIGLSSMTCPGLSTLLLNLSRTVSHHMPIGTAALPWHYEYWWGAGMEVYRTPLSPYFQGMTFKRIASILYNELQVVLIGIDRDTSRQLKRSIQLCRSMRRSPDRTRDPEQAEMLLAAMDHVVDVNYVTALVVARQSRPLLKIASYRLNEEMTSPDPSSRREWAGSSHRAVSGTRAAQAARDLTRLSVIAGESKSSSNDTTGDIMSSLHTSFAKPIATSAGGFLARMWRGGLPETASQPRERRPASREASGRGTPPGAASSAAAGPGSGPKRGAKLETQPEEDHGAAKELPGRISAQQRWWDKAQSMDECTWCGWLYRLLPGRTKGCPQGHELYSVSGVSSKHIFASSDAHNPFAEVALGMLACNKRTNWNHLDLEVSCDSVFDVDAHGQIAQVQRVLDRLAVVSITDLLDGMDLTMPASAEAGLSRHKLMQWKALEANYHVRPFGWRIQESTLESVDFQNHILITGWDYPSIACMVSTFRRSYIGRLRPIVIMDSRRPVDNWESVSVFQAVYFINGCGHNQDDLVRANAQGACRVILLPATADEVSSSHRSDDSRADPRLVITYQHMQLLAPTVPVVTELTKGSNQAFFKGNSVLGGCTLEHQQLSASYAAGQEFLPAMLDALCFGTFFNPDFIRVLRAMLFQQVGKAKVDDAPEQQSGLNGLAGTSRPAQPVSREDAASGSVVTQVPVPAHLHGAMYSQLVNELRDRRDMVVLGLYRGEDCPVRGNQLPYVYTNPPHETIVNPSDRVFVVCQYIPPGSCVQTSSSGEELLEQGQEAIPVDEPQAESRSACNTPRRSSGRGLVYPRRIQRRRSSLLSIMSTASRGSVGMSAEISGGGLVSGPGQPTDASHQAKDTRPESPQKESQMESWQQADTEALKGIEVELFKQPEAEAHQRSQQVPPESTDLTVGLQDIEADMQDLALEAMYGLCQTMHEDIRELRRELNEVRQAQKLGSFRGGRGHTVS